MYVKAVLFKRFQTVERGSRDAPTTRRQGGLRYISIGNNVQRQGLCLIRGILGLGDELGFAKVEEGPANVALAFVATADACVEL